MFESLSKYDVTSHEESANALGGWGTDLGSSIKGGKQFHPDFGIWMTTWKYTA